MHKFVGDEDAPEWLNSAFMHAVNLILKRDRPDMKGTLEEDARVKLSGFSLNYEVADCGNMTLELLYFPSGTGERNYDIEGEAVEYRGATAELVAENEIEAMKQISPPPEKRLERG